MNVDLQQPVENIFFIFSLFGSTNGSLPATSPPVRCAEKPSSEGSHPLITATSVVAHWVYLNVRIDLCT